MLKKSFSELDLSLKSSSFAVDNRELGAKLSAAFENCSLVFIVGGLGIDDSRGIKNIISHALIKAYVDECKKLSNNQGEDGYVIRAGKQILVLLPDEPSQIQEIMQGPVSRYIQVTNNARV
jgi:hypothetical protein